VLAPAAQHLALAAGQVQEALIGLQAADGAERHQLLARERIQDAVMGLGDLVLSKGQMVAPSYRVR
jgi:hypothetical protein